MYPVGDPKTGTEPKLRYEELTEQIIGAAIEVHKIIGPGVLESVYEECLCHELSLRGLSFERQLVVPIAYKSVERVLPIHEAQLLTYLRLLKKPVGLIINFNVTALRHGIVRRAL